RHHGIGVCLAGHGQAHRGRHLLPRFSGSADGAHPLRHGLRGDQPDGRPALHGARPSHPVLVMTTELETVAIGGFGRRYPKMLIAAVVGVLVGLVASWGGGRADAVIMRVADVQLAFPVIMLAIAIVAVVGTNPLALVGVLALSGWVLYARTVRAHVLTIRSLEYIEAAYTLGATDRRIVLRHVLPNTVAPILVIGSSQFATLVLL